MYDLQDTSRTRHFYNSAKSLHRLFSPGRSDERGHAFLEFAIILPLIGIIFVGAIEFSRMFRVKEMMALASREAAHEAFRECFDTERQQCNGTTYRTDICLNKYAAQINTTVQQFLPSVTLTISMYVWDDVTMTADLAGITFDPLTGNPSSSDFDITNVVTHFRDLLERQKVIVIAEVIYDFPLFFDSGLIPDLTLHDVTVF